MRGFKNPFAVYLQRNSTYIGQGYFHGILYDLGAYPAAIPSKNTEDKVYGELYQLKENWIPVLNAMDEYEGVGVQFPQPNQYYRENVNIYLDEQEIIAWVYFYHNPRYYKRIITSGRYPKH